MNFNKFEQSFKKLQIFCETEQFKGWDPYDGLNSWVIQKTPLGKSSFFRLAWIQLFKRNPINFRKIVGIKKGFNSKGLGLFLIGYCNLYKVEPKKEYLEKIHLLATKILNLSAKGYSGYCWGYNFDWQARAFFQPKNTPTVVATSFIGEALIEAYKITKEDTYLEAAISSTEFILNDLNKSYDADGDFTLSYSPLDSTQVFNAGLLGAKLLCLVYNYKKDKEFLNVAKKIVSYVCKNQQPDGSWAYGTLPFHKWVDNFHTGYNLECINAYYQVSKDSTFNKNIERSFLFDFFNLYLFF